MWPNQLMFLPGLLFLGVRLGVASGPVVVGQQVDSQHLIMNLKFRRVGLNLRTLRDLTNKEKIVGFIKCYQKNRFWGENSSLLICVIKMYIC
jgi:hypothetical protein